MALKAKGFPSFFIRKSESFGKYLLVFLQPPSYFAHLSSHYTLVRDALKENRRLVELTYEDLYPKSARPVLLPLFYARFVGLLPFHLCKLGTPGKVKYNFIVYFPILTTLTFLLQLLRPPYL
jgi:hypothetical protein